MGKFKFLASQVSIERVGEKIKRIFIQKITITTISNKNFNTSLVYLKKRVLDDGTPALFY
jgi:hypothetical protein